MSSRFCQVGDMCQVITAEASQWVSVYIVAQKPSGSMVETDRLSINLAQKTDQTLPKKKKKKLYDMGEKQLLSQKDVQNPSQLYKSLACQDNCEDLCEFLLFMSGNHETSQLHHLLSQSVYFKLYFVILV